MEEFQQLLIQYLPDIIFGICNIVAYILVIVFKVGFNKAKNAMNIRVDNSTQKMKNEVAEIKAENEQLKKEMKELKNTLVKAFDFDEVNKND